jgi:hypothetical protein
MIHANIVVPLLAVVTGWAALYPVRREMGPWLYHLLAFPVGIMAWTIVAGLATLFGTPFTPAIVIGGHVLLVVAVAGCGLALRDPGHRAAVPAWTWAVWGIAAAGATVLLDHYGRTAVSSDSVVHFEMSGIWLFLTGRLDPLTMGSYGPLVPAMHAGARFFGAQWTFTPYPLFSLTTLAVLGVVLAATAFRKLPLVWRVVASLVAVAILGATPMWLSQSFLVHSNMVSAMLLLGSVVGLMAGAGFLSSVAPAADAAWWLVSGVCATGLALARPDGIAYAVVVLIVAAVIYARRLVSSRALAALYVGFFVTALLVFAPVFAREGLWASTKLPGSVALALLAFTAVVGACTALFPRLGRFGAWLSRPKSAVRLLLVSQVVAIGALTLVRSSGFIYSTRNMVGNLAYAGGWGFLWYAVVGILVVALLFRRATGLGERESLVLFAVAQFFLVAYVIHGLSHEGRLAPMDSFNRLALHALPLAWWYCASVVGGLLTGCRKAGPVRAR